MISRIYGSEFYYGLIRKKQGVINARPLEKKFLEVHRFNKWALHAKLLLLNYLCSDKRCIF